MLSILKREFPDGNFQSLFEGTSRAVSSSSASIAADPLLSSFISPMTDDFFISESSLSAETNSAKKTLNQSLPERYASSFSFGLEIWIRHCIAIS